MLCDFGIIHLSFSSPEQGSCKAIVLASYSVSALAASFTCFMLKFFVCK